MALLTTKLVKHFGLDDAFKLAGFSLGTAVKPVAAWVEKMLSRRGAPGGPLPPGAFSEPWWQLLTIGAVAFQGAQDLAGFVAGMVAGAEAVIPAVTGVIVIPVMVFVLGCWMGTRSGWNGLIVLFGATSIGFLLGRIIDQLMVSDSMAAMMQIPRELLGFANIKWFLIGLAVVLSCTIVIGVPAFLIGRRRRYSAYLHSILRTRPPAEQREIVELVYTRAVAVAGRPQSAR